MMIKGPKLTQAGLNRVGTTQRGIMIRVGSRFAIVTQCRIDGHCLFDMNSGSVDPQLPSDIGALRDDLKKLTYRKNGKPGCQESSDEANNAGGPTMKNECNTTRSK